MSEASAGRTTVTAGFSRISRQRGPVTASKKCSCLCHDGHAVHLMACSCYNTPQNRSEGVSESNLSE